MNTKENIINRLRETNRENIEKVIDYMEKNRFFEVGCHRHHRYDGGLADHAWQTYQLAIKKEADNKRLHPDVPLLDKDSLAICALLHDFCNCRNMRHIKGHGRRSAEMLKELGFHLSQEEFLAIRFHMSLKDKKSHPLFEDALHCHLRHIVHKADGKSAKKYTGFGA
jgi:hypothetical protein